MLPKLVRHPTRDLGKVPLFPVALDAGAESLPQEARLRSRTPNAKERNACRMGLHFALISAWLRKLVDLVAELLAKLVRSGL